MPHHRHGAKDQQALPLGQAQAEIHAIELLGTALEQVDHGAVGNHRGDIVQLPGIDLHLLQQAVGVAAQLPYQFREARERGDLDQGCHGFSTSSERNRSSALHPRQFLPVATEKIHG
ncbi:hypothetical protein D3C76_1609910 [compost metagenome]